MSTMPEVQRLRAFLDQLGERANVLGGEIAYGDIFRTEGHPYPFYSPTTEDLRAVLDRLQELEKPKLPGPRVPIDCYAHHAFGED